MKTKIISPKLFLLLFYLYGIVNLHAELACPDTFNISQPDDTFIKIRLHGDEWFHWNSTEDNVPIIKNNVGVYEYAIILDSIFEPSGVKAHDYLERNDSEKEYINSKVNSKSQRDLLSACIRSARKRSLSDDGAKGKQTPNATGIFRFVTILMDFPDKQFIFSQNDFDSLMNQPNYTGNGNNGSVYDYYYDNSCHQLTTQSIVVGPFRAQHNFEYYSSSDSRTRTLIREAVNASKSYVDFSLCDNNNDGYVDLVHVVFAGHAASLSPSYQSIWPHYSSLVLPIYDDGKKIYDYIITSGYNYGSGTTMSGIGTICHELGHALGAPDFYDNDVSNGDYNATGSWDVMADGSHNKGRCCPAMHNPYTVSQIFNWRGVENITTKSTPYNLSPIETSLTQKYYRLNTSTTGEYFLLENRQKIDWDSYITSYGGGLLIYHIHADIGNVSSHDLNDTHPLHCYIVNCAANTEPNSTPTSYGDLYYAAYPGIYNNKQFFNATSTPRAQSWAGNATTHGLYYIQRVSNNIQFMVNPSINGNSSLCNSGQYSLTGIPSSASIIWTYETNIQQVDTFPIIRLSNIMGTSTTVQRGTYRPYANGPQYLYSGYVTLKAHVIYSGFSKTYSKTLFMHEDGKPILPASSLLQIGWQETRTFTISNFTDVPDNMLKWVITMPQATSTITHYGHSWTVTPTTPGTLNIKLYNLENCSTALHSNYNIVVNFLIPVEPPLLSHPNPVTTSSVDIHITNNNNKETSGGEDSEHSPSTIYYTLELWDDQSRALKSINGELSGEEDIVTLDISGLNNGIYLLTLKVDNQIVRTSKIIINR